MPLQLSWSRDEHFKEAPRVFVFIWVVSSIALVVVAFLSIKKAVQTACLAHRSRSRRDHIFLPRLQEAEIGLALAPFFFAWVGWASVCDMQIAGVLQFLINIVVAVMLSTTRDLLVAALGEEPGVKQLLKSATPQAWWRTPPCCCLAGVCLNKEPEPLKPRHLRFGKYMVDLFVMVNLMDALTRIATYSSIQQVTVVDGWCKTKQQGQDIVQQVITQLQGIAAPFAMYAVGVLAKGAAACFGDDDPLKLLPKGSMAGNISLFTGLGPVISGALAKGYRTPTLSASTTLIGAAVGCPVYDQPVMAQMWFAAALPVLMVPYAIQLSTLVQVDDAKMAKELRADRLNTLLMAESATPTL